eukprot:5631824-Pyramimonas_sp.AAC.1
MGFETHDGRVTRYMKLHGIALETMPYHETRRFGIGAPRQGRCPTTALADSTGLRRVRRPRL